MNLRQGVPGVMLAALLTAGVVALSRVPWTAVQGEDGELRLAWRWRSERVQECRKLSAEELAKLPVHMRRSEVCEGRLRPYVLEVTIDGTSVARDTVRASGAESDRPLYVFRRFALTPGTHAARVVFSPVQGAREAALTLDTPVTVSPRHVALVTLDTDRGVLVTRTGEP